MARRISRQPIATLATALLIALLAIGADQPLTLEQRAVLDHISADSLRGHLSFIASDALEGRATPSRGLDLAAEYIAAQFRKAGLEPIGDDGYFQTASITVREPNWQDFEMTVTRGDTSMRVTPADVRFTPDLPIRLDSAPIISVSDSTNVTPALVRGKVV